jgi:hypothetical protein
MELQDLNQVDILLVAVVAVLLGQEMHLLAVPAVAAPADSMVVVAEQSIPVQVVVVAETGQDNPHSQNQVV